MLAQSQFEADMRKIGRILLLTVSLYCSFVGIVMVGVGQAFGSMSAAAASVNRSPLLVIGGWGLLCFPLMHGYLSIFGASFSLKRLLWITTVVSLICASQKLLFMYYI